MPSARGQAPRAASLDAVTVDAAGTAVELVDPTDRLRSLLAERGVLRERQAVAGAFAAEVAYYMPRSERGRDEASLAELRRESVAVFLAHLSEEELEPDRFVPAFMSAIEFRPVKGASAALSTLRGAGLELACVANWDIGLRGQLERAGLAGSFAAIVSSAEAGARKPGAAVFRVALEHLGVEPSRALHIGDDPVDEEGAHAAGLAFEPAPLATLPERLGLRATR